MNRRPYIINSVAPALIDRKKILVRFSEVDALHIVWHGEYLRYFEDGRESFGNKYGIAYWDIYNQGLKAPIVDLSCQYKHPLTFGEEAIIETRYIPTKAAKLIFEYIIHKTDRKTVVATGHTIQVFLNERNEMELPNPEFYSNWKKKWNID
jgi:acyl-CoA thioester hydrolase